MTKRIESLLFDRQERRLENTLNQLIERLEGKADRTEEKLQQQFQQLEQRLQQQLQQTEEKLQQQLRQSDEKAEARFVHVEKVVNDVGSRVTRLDGMLQAYTEQASRAAASYGELLERVVRVEVAQSPGGMARLEQKLDSALKLHPGDDPRK